MTFEEDVKIVSGDVNDSIEQFLENKARFEKAER